MKTIETTVYEYSELSDAAKEKALAWFSEAQFDDDIFDNILEDAKAIGLNIISLDDRRANAGSFRDNAQVTANKITEEHGKDCETYKTAIKFLTDFKTQNNEEGSDAEETLAHDFLQALLEDYRIMLNKEQEYRQSREYLEEGIGANEYTFTEEGKRFG